MFTKSSKAVVLSLIAFALVIGEKVEAQQVEACFAFPPPANIFCQNYCRGQNCDEFPGPQCEALRQQFAQHTGTTVFPCDHSAATCSELPEIAQDVCFEYCKVLGCGNLPNLPFCNFLRNELDRILGTRVFPCDAQCLVDIDCDDGLFCNGAELCVDGTCSPGVNPCGPGLVCDEGSDLCGPCVSNADCNDGLFCNGAEQCNPQTGECNAVSACPPAIDGCIIRNGECDEENDQCLDVIDESLCDDDDSCTIDFCANGECIHNRDPNCAAGVRIDIEPGCCPNPIYTNGAGVIRVVIVGGAGLDPHTVDLASLELVRYDGIGGVVRPLRRPAPMMVDVASPFDGSACDCHRAERDGTSDLSLKFAEAIIVRDLELGGHPDKEREDLVLRGRFDNGTPFEAGDCVEVRHGRRPRCPCDK